MRESVFKNTFLSLLNEDIESKEDSLQSDPESERQAFVNTLDPDTDPSEYDITPSSVRSIGRMHVEDAKKWVQILNDFADLINSGENPDSLNNFLNKVDREGSAFRGIVRSQGKRVTRIAEECAAMAQVLESNIIGSAKKERELLQQFPNLQA